MPCYNTVGSQLFEAVNSVYAQGLDPDTYEILIVNDGSTNKDTLAALEQVKDYPNVRVFHQENKGQSAARNLALRNGRFKYAMGLDSDDYLNHDPKFLAKHGSYLTRALGSLEEDVNLAMIYCGHYKFGVGRTLKALSIPYSEKFFLVRGGVGAFTFYRREDALKAGGYPEELDHIEDRAFVISLLNQRLKDGTGRGVLKFPEPYYYYRQYDHGNNVNARKRSLHAFFDVVISKNPEIFLEHFPNIPRDNLIQHLVDEIHSFKSGDWKLLFSAAAQNPVWAATRVLPFIRGRVGSIFDRASKNDNEQLSLEHHGGARFENPAIR